MDSIPRIRRELITRFTKLVRTRALALGIETVDFRTWVDSVVGEGIAIALLEQEKWDPQKGNFLQWAFLKTWDLTNRDFRVEERHQKIIAKLKRLAPTEKTPDRILDQLIMCEELAGILNELTEEQRQGLALYYLTGMSVETLSDILGKKPKTVYAMLERARTKARRVTKKTSKPLKAEKISFEAKRRHREQRKESEQFYGEA